MLSFERLKEIRDFLSHSLFCLGRRSGKTIAIEVFRDIETLIDEAIAGQWVSVSERLPERGGNYLCCDEDTMVIFAADYDASGWQRPLIAPFYREVTVTHWKPLPEPPKGETP